MDAASYDVGGAFGLREYHKNPWVWPYVFFGFGGITYNIKQNISPPLQMFISSRPPGNPDITVQENKGREQSLLIAIDELGLETKFALNLGVGTDLRVPFGPVGVGLRR